MSTTEKIVKANKRGKKLDLASATVVDAALQSPTSVYEMCGIHDQRYRAKNMEDYKRSLASMNLLELQDHAYQVGVTPNPDRTTIIDRLERKYLQENPRSIPSVGVVQATGAEHDALRRQAEEIMRQRR